MFNIIKYLLSDPPKCLSPTQTIPANIGRPAFLFCEVGSSLMNVTFFWYSKHIHKTDFKIVNKGLKSKLIINPKTGEDFGQYTCWARSLAGNQIEPCLFNIYGRDLFSNLYIKYRVNGS